MRRGRAIDFFAIAVAALFAGGWVVALDVVAAGDVAPRFGSRVTINPFAPTAPPEAAVLVDAAMRALASYDVYRGESGALRVAVVEPGDTALDLGVEPPEEPGIWEIVLSRGAALRRLPDFSIITTVPTSRIQGGRLGDYLIGRWPTAAERGTRFGDMPAYDPPSGLIRVTPDMVHLPVSEHFTLGDFLTKGQSDVWPKYVVMSPRLLDKLELTIQELERTGHPVDDVGIISGFRTPHYNVAGGDPSGRGDLSRHMYGDAMDWFVDNDRDGGMDDLSGDGVVDAGDGRVIRDAADAVEQAYPHLVGGIGVYAPTGAHRGFVHIDTRGYRARW
ncbi:MAG: hypothetical protein ACRELV_00130 [Longimicrobiales bacterium]